MRSPVCLVLLFLISTSIDLTLCQAQATPLTSSPEQVNDIIHVDLKTNDNVVRHHTSQYRQITHFSTYASFRGSSIVLRRAEKFDFVLTLRQAYNKTTDRIRLEFNFGPKPQIDKGTQVYLPVHADTTSFRYINKWDARVVNVTGNRIEVQVNIPANCPIGIWRLSVSSKVAHGQKIRTYSVREAIYVIFNAWSQQDAVYMTREEARQEYVLNEVGKIYMGHYARPTGHKWNYGQFHESVLPAVVNMLELTRLDVVARSDVVKVSRAISAMVNSHDENGLLVGNWSGNYGGGLAPWQWQGSAAIFERYMQQGGRPVKFGQCWVFGGVTTTALRTLGIPARTISNFVSAHDTDFSLTIDTFYSEGGDKLTGVNTDSIWNFHVWSDAWMERYDLPPGYGGWQAIDATPQETSMGVYQLGPASLEAIKQGRVGFAYDVGFVFSEVNADVIQWRHDDRSAFQWRRTSIQSDHVGRKILTKMIGILDERTRYGVNDAEDIVDQYKYPEGSREERSAYREAVRLAGLNSLLDKV